MTLTETTIGLPDGRALDPGQWFRIKGERGVYRASERSCGGAGVWAYGGDRDPKGRRSWRCVALERVGQFERVPKGHRELGVTPPGEDGA